MILHFRQAPPRDKENTFNWWHSRICLWSKAKYQSFDITRL